MKNIMTTVVALVAMVVAITFLTLFIQFITGPPAEIRSLERTISALREEIKSLEMEAAALVPTPSPYAWFWEELDIQIHETINAECWKTVSNLTQALTDQKESLSYCWTQTVKLGACYQNPVFCPWYEEE